MGNLYDSDIFEWSEQQARLLRQQMGGRPYNEVPDWDNIIKEVESVGRNQINAVRFLLTLAIRHDLKAEAWPLALAVPHWRAEARAMRRETLRSLTPAMRQRLNVSELYRDALWGLPDTLDGQAPLPVPQTATLTLDDLLTG